jgi:DNA invertase Pin-like site-specific DNA recombinase
MTGLDKIRSEHRERTAFVYARQSTPAQVIEHKSSTQRQLGLTDRALELGWAPNLVVVVDDDLGRSGASVDGREGFQRMAAEMTMGRAGAILSLDASRLARSSADWHRLLEIAALTRTLLIDEQTVYDPRDPNDRLVLGMKGTMADFELVWLRQRMEGGRWHLARRAEYRLRPCVGYVYEDEEATRFVLDPDDEIRRAVELLFERYRSAGSVGDVVRYFADHKLRFPSRYGKRVVWNTLTPCRVHTIISNPLYAGAYAFGRAHRELVIEDGRRRRRVRRLPMSQWPVLVRDTHPAYIPWEVFVANQKRISENRARRDTRGAAREGRALLQGLLICGHCGARLSVRYSGQNGRYPSYDCNRLRDDGIGENCLHVYARNLDEPIVKIVLSMLTHDRLLDATRVVEMVDEQDAALERQWKLRLERARYEAKRAERQYDACEPDNRVVARTLEKRWNDRLVEVERLEHEYDEFKRRRRFELSDLDRQRILQLASNVSRLWHAKTTEDRDRKLLLRMLLKDISVRAIDVPRSALRVRLLWHTHAATDLEIARPGRGAPGRKITYQVLGTTSPVASTMNQNP